MLKPGAILFSNDVLDQTGFFAGAAHEQAAGAGPLPAVRLPREGPVALSARTGAVGIVRAVQRHPEDRSNIIAPPAGPSRSTSATTCWSSTSPSAQPVVLAVHADARVPVCPQPVHIDHRTVLSIPSTGQSVSGSSDLYLIAQRPLALTSKVDAIFPSRTAGSVRWDGDRRSSFRTSSTSSTRRIRRSTEVRDPHRYWSPVYKRFELHARGAELEGVYPVLCSRTTRSSLSARSARSWAAGGRVLRFLCRRADRHEGLSVLCDRRELKWRRSGCEYRFPLVNNLEFRIVPDLLRQAVCFGLRRCGQRVDRERPHAEGTSRPTRDASSGWRRSRGTRIRPRIFFNAAYGFDGSTGTSGAGTAVTYGKEWRFYFGVLFGFDFD